MVDKLLLRVLSLLTLTALLAVGCAGNDTAISPTTESSTAETPVGDSADTEADGSAASTPDEDEEESGEGAQAEPTSVPDATPAPAAAGDEEEDAAPDAATEETSDAGPGSRSEAVAFIVEEGFVTDDAECLVDGFYEIFASWDVEGIEPEEAQEDDLNLLLETCIRTIPGPQAGSPPPGTDAALDLLWIGCNQGDADACDDLYFESPLDSDYETYGLSCGGRTALGDCTEVLGEGSDGGGESSGGVPGPAAGSPPPGDNAELDELWVSCSDGSAEACDNLFFQAPSDSDYEAFGLSCGGRELAFCSDVLGDS